MCDTGPIRKLIHRIGEDRDFFQNTVKNVNNTTVSVENSSSLVSSCAPTPRPPGVQKFAQFSTLFSCNNHRNRFKPVPVRQLHLTIFQILDSELKLHILRAGINNRSEAKPFFTSRLYS